MVRRLRGKWAILDVSVAGIHAPVSPHIRLHRCSGCVPSAIECTVIAWLSAPGRGGVTVWSARTRSDGELHVGARPVLRCRSHCGGSESSPVVVIRMAVAYPHRWIDCGSAV